MRSKHLFTSEVKLCPTEHVLPIRHGRALVHVSGPQGERSQRGWDEPERDFYDLDKHDILRTSITD